MSTFSEWNSLFSEPEKESNAPLKITIRALAGVGNDEIINREFEYNILGRVNADVLNNTNLQIPIPFIIDSPMPEKPAYYSLSDFQSKVPFRSTIQIYPGSFQYDSDLIAGIKNNGGYFELAEYIKIPMKITTISSISIDMEYTGFSQEYLPKVKELASERDVELAIKQNSIPKGNIGDKNFLYEYSDENQTTEICQFNIQYNWRGTYNMNNDTINWQPSPNNDAANASLETKNNAIRNNIIDKAKTKIVSMLNYDNFKKNSKNITSLVRVADNSPIGIDGLPACKEKKYILAIKNIIRSVILEFNLYEEITAVNIKFPHKGAALPVTMSKYGSVLTYFPPPGSQRPAGWHGGGIWPSR